MFHLSYPPFCAALNEVVLLAVSWSEAKDTNDSEISDKGKKVTKGQHHHAGRHYFSQSFDNHQ